MTKQRSIYRAAAIAIFGFTALVAIVKNELSASPQRFRRATTSTQTPGLRLPSNVAINESNESPVLLAVEQNLIAGKQDASIDETKTLQWNVDYWENQVVNKYKANDTKNQLDIISGIGMGGVFEMEDGRDAKCLESFYAIWKSEQPFSGENFFYWLDRGSGRNVAISCTRDRLNQQRYAIYSEAEKEASVVELWTESSSDDEDVENKVWAIFSGTKTAVPEGRWLTVWDVDHRLYMLKDERYPSPDHPFEYVMKRGHCSVTQGKPVLYAGEVVIGKDGEVLYTYPKSGQ